MLNLSGKVTRVFLQVFKHAAQTFDKIQRYPGLFRPTGFYVKKHLAIILKNSAKRRLAFNRWNSGVFVFNILML